MSRQHWSLAGSYERFANRTRHGSAQTVVVTRYCCGIVKRTFSLLQDALLPYHAPTVSQILPRLHAMVVEGIPTNTLARRLDLPRKTLADLKSKFLSSTPALRLPGSDRAPNPADLLKNLASQSGSAIAQRFRDWKESEPKHSIVGIYAR